MIDLRSDTVTKPGPGMIKAMYAADTGDDVFREDPTVNILEERVAALFGKEAALFVPSGTMANQIAIRVQCKPGDELICDSMAHIYNYEVAGIAANSGVQARLVNSGNGIMQAVDIEPLIQADYDWLGRTKMICLENTVNRAGGTVYPIETIREITKLSSMHGLILHLDGARIFNAIKAAGYSAIDIGQEIETISVCFSKGLGCPVGSVLIGSDSFVREARRVRKLMGGGMRQIGFLAAACLYALDHNLDRLEEDHRHLRMLHDTLAGMQDIESLTEPITNILLFSLGSRIEPEQFNRRLREKGVLIQPFGGRRVRMVTHLDITTEDIRQVQSVLQEIERN